MTKSLIVQQTDLGEGVERSYLFPRNLFSYCVTQPLEHFSLRHMSLIWTKNLELIDCSCTPKFTLFFSTPIGLWFIKNIHAYHCFYGFGIKASLLWHSSTFGRKRNDNQCKKGRISSTSWPLKLQGFSYDLRHFTGSITSSIGWELQENGNWWHSHIFWSLS